MKKLLGLVIIILVIALGLWGINKKKQSYLLRNEVRNQNKTIENSKQKTDKQNETSSIDKKELVRQTLVGKGYDSILFLYNDIDVDKAMEQPGAPQNLAHDGKIFYYFYTDSTFKHTSVGKYASSDSGTCKIDNEDIILNMGGGITIEIPYEIKDNTVIFPNWNQYYDTNKYTYQFVPDISAKSYIEEKTIQH
ncbi:MULTISPECIES: hypothetical protein [Leuconostoc]|uniref:hypothetical protein n=1 Tax=Leuconostoc TaxID=1243 RepID=UPI002182092E|nr:MULTISPECIES: hypothetical protein [Leuconostoc]MCS8587263.1 hypothetical protein [Leuconostoc citreum]MCT4380661.1 hypothetical protein [Leuconostoc pseudomesenteroides]